MVVGRDDNFNEGLLTDLYQLPAINYQLKGTQAMNTKRNLQDDLRGTYAKSWTVSIDHNGKRIVHVHYHEKPQTKKMTIES